MAISTCRHCGIESDDPRADQACASVGQYRHDFTSRELVSDCIYFNYKFNRMQSPDVAPSEWACIYGDHRIPDLEKRFQLDKERR